MEDANEVVPEHVVIDVPEALQVEKWLKRAGKNIKKEPKLLNNVSGWDSCSIFRAPQTLKKFHRHAFEPEIVSIGPYHHGKRQLRMIQEHKWRLLGHVLDRTKESNVSLDDFYRAIAIKEKEIRDCYSDSETVDRFDSQKLIEMMVLDGCFILELVFMIERVVVSQNDPIFMPRWILYSISRDFLKLENQIPLFVLRILFKSHWEFLLKGKETSLSELIIRFFHFSIQINDRDIPDWCKNLDGEHLLDLFGKRFMPSPPVSSNSETKKKKEAATDKFVLQCFQFGNKKRTKRECVQSIRPVEKLVAAGIKFEKSETALSFLDIKFRADDGVLEIPTSFTGTLTRAFFLNCIAFEQCYRFCETYYTSYAVFMNCLISTTSDASHLLDERIFENSGTDEVVKFFNELKHDVFIDIKRSYLAKVIDDVNEYYGNVWHVRLAEFKYNYFGSPWIFLSALAALILLILTIIQSFFSVYGYINPP